MRQSLMWAKQHTNTESQKHTDPVHGSWAGPFKDISVIPALCQDVLPVP